MKFATALAFALTAATVSASSLFNTNANRLARGLPPNAPFKRATPASRASLFFKKNNYRACSYSAVAKALGGRSLRVAPPGANVQSVRSIAANPLNMPIAPQHQAISPDSSD